MNKILNLFQLKEEFDERQSLKRFRYGLHCYAITLILLLIYCSMNVLFKYDFQNKLDLLLVIIASSSLYYIFRLILDDSFIPNNVTISNKMIIILFFIVTVVSTFRFFSFHLYDLDLINKGLLNSELIEGFILMVYPAFILFSFFIKIIYEKKINYDESV